jgi:hypothetical protein
VVMPVRVCTASTMSCIRLLNMALAQCLGLTGANS